MFDSLWHHGLLPPGLLCPWNFSGKNTGVGCHPNPGDIPNPGIECQSLTSPASAGEFFLTSATWEAQFNMVNIYLIIWSVPSLIYFYGVHLHDRKTLPYFCCSTEENITQLKHKILKSFPTLRCSNFETSINFPNSFTFTFLWLVFITHVFEYS